MNALLIAHLAGGLVIAAEASTASIGSWLERIGAV